MPRPTPGMISYTGPLTHRREPEEHPMPAVETYVIVGASLAGAKAAQALREEGFAGAVVLIGAEHERPYERPPLSKDLLLGKAEPGSVFVHDAGWYADNSVELRLGTRVTSVDRAERQVHLEDGSAVGYTRLLLATGSSPRRLPVPGADLEGVLYLRTLGDSQALSAAFQPGATVAIAGAGWIGLETAAAARQAGGEGTGELRGDGAVVRQVVTSGGAELPADVVVVGIGAAPNVGLAADAGLEVD